MKRSIILLVSLSLIFIFTLAEVQTVYGAWIEGAGYNLSEWDSYSEDAWESKDTEFETYFTYNQDVENFGSWNATIYLDDYRIGGYWWISWITQEFTLKVANRDNATENIEGTVFQTVGLGAFGVYWYEVGWTFPEQVPLVPFQNNRRREASALPMSFRAIKLYTDRLLIQVMIEGYEWTYWTYQVSSGFFNNVTLSFRVKKSLGFGGVGFIEGHKGEEAIGSKVGGSSAPPLTPFSPIGFTLPSIITLVPSAIVVGILGFSFSKVGDNIGGHGIAGLLIGLTLGFILLAQFGAIPYQIVLVILFLGGIALFLWLRSG